jgi:hypothetical protein
VEVLILVGVLTTSLILLAAGAEHVAGRAMLRSRLRVHQVLGAGGIRSVSAGLPVLELLVAVSAFLSVATSSRPGLVASLLLQTALYWSFAGYLVMVVRAGNAGAPCGCGLAEAPVGGSAIARAIGLGVLSCASAVSSAVVDLNSTTVRPDARGVLTCVAGFTLAVLLMILPSARRLEPPSRPHAGPHPSDPSNPGNTPEPMMIGSA